MSGKHRTIGNEPSTSQRNQPHRVTPVPYEPRHATPDADQPAQPDIKPPITL